LSVNAFDPGLDLATRIFRKDGGMKTQSMKTQSGKSAGWSLVLVALGLLALYSGPRGLALLVPAATLVWYAVMKRWTDRHRN
jgi:hypothetical protein